MVDKFYKNTPLIIAEIGSVHDGSFGNAIKLIEAASKAGADVVKFQTHIAEAETLKEAPSPSYFSLEPRYDYFLRTSFTLDQWFQLKNACIKNNVLFLSSPFSLEAVDLLEKIDTNFYKIPSGEVTNTPLLEKISKTNKTVFLSSGMSSYIELDQAINFFNNSNDLVVMQCTSEYPCPPTRVGLNVLKEIKDKYNCKVGFSDHTLGFAASFAAAALGANYIEKHFTFSRLMYGSDAKNSMEPNEFSIFCQGIKDIWEMLDNPVDKNSIEQYSEMKMIFQKSIVLKDDFEVGHIISFEDLAFKKPGNGIPSNSWKDIIGKKLVNKIKKNQILKKEDFI